MKEIAFSEGAGVRYLHFGSEWVQGAMRMASPNALELNYVQDMMAWLMFLAPPAQITQLGLGAASLTKFCLAKCPPSQVTAVELSDTVIMAAQMWFKLNWQHKRLRMVNADADKFLAQAPALSVPNVLQVDLYDAKARGPVLDSAAFYKRCKQYIGGNCNTPAIAVFNFFGSSNFIASRERVARAFRGRIIELAPCVEGNIIVLAFTGPEFKVSLATLEKRAAFVSQKFGLPTARWMASLRQTRHSWMIGSENVNLGAFQGRS
jgi:spermidine synthase